MDNGTSNEELQEKEEKTTTEPAEEDTSVAETELDSDKKALEESQALLKRYKEQVAGSQAEAQKLKQRIDELETQVSSAPEPVSDLSAQDIEYRNYLRKLGVYTKDEVEKMVQERIAPFQASTEARNRRQQKTILDEFISTKPDLALSKDIDGARMQKVINRLKRISPEDPFDPNSSLKEDLELAYKWEFGDETNQEAISKAKAVGRAEGHEASEAKVGEGASVSSSRSGKARTAEQEALLREWGVDDESLNKPEK